MRKIKETSVEPQAPVLEPVSDQTKEPVAEPACATLYTTIPRLCLAAPKSGSGKTTVAAALMWICREQGLAVQAFKCGPDYIDPMFHQNVLGVASVNLDTWFTDPETARQLFVCHCQRSRSGSAHKEAISDEAVPVAAACTNTDRSSYIHKGRGDHDSEGSRNDYVPDVERRFADLALIEGVMGLYDGLGGIREEGSTYDLAQTLACPIILIIDARGMGRSVEAQIRGFLSMDTAHLIKGIILNRVSAAYAGILKELIEDNLPVKVLGALPDNPLYALPSRYLGLCLPEETKNLQEKIKGAANDLYQNLDLSLLLQIAGADHDVAKANHIVAGADHVAAKANHIATSADHVVAGATHIATSADFPAMAEDTSERFHQPAVHMTDTHTDGQIRPQKECGLGGESIERIRNAAVPIAVARDAAFCFYYEDNLRLLEQFGARLLFFSPVKDKHLPAGTCGVYLGGGYPELYAKELSENHSMREEIRCAYENGLPFVAECGGFMYLHSFLTDKEGKTWTMAGVLPGRSFYTGHLTRFGYMELTEKVPHFLPAGERIRGHEFHYYDCDGNGTDCRASKPVGGRSWECAYETDRSFLGFPHLYWPSNPSFAEHFVQACENAPAALRAAAGKA